MSRRVFEFWYKSRQNRIGNREPRECYNQHGPEVYIGCVALSFDHEDRLEGPPSGTSRLPLIMKTGWRGPPSLALDGRGMNELCRRIGCPPRR